jgi:hypothetical protein
MESRGCITSMPWIPPALNSVPATDQPHITSPRQILDAGGQLL